eukprot:2188245-Amphidinium_carterae.2
MGSGTAVQLAGLGGMLGTQRVTHSVTLTILKVLHCLVRFVRHKEGFEDLDSVGIVYVQEVSLKIFPSAPQLPHFINQSSLCVVHAHTHTHQQNPRNSMQGLRTAPLILFVFISLTPELYLEANNSDVLERPGRFSSRNRPIAEVWKSEAVQAVHAWYLKTSAP